MTVKEKPIVEKEHVPYFRGVVRLNRFRRRFLLKLAEPEGVILSRKVLRKTSSKSEIESELGRKLTKNEHELLLWVRKQKSLLFSKKPEEIMPYLDMLNERRMAAHRTRKK